MNKSFIDSVISDLNRRFNAFDSVILVIPNKRPELFIHRAISELIDKPCFSPKIITINQIFSEVSDLKTEESLNTIIRIYYLFKKHTSSNESLENFFFWGEMIAADFDDCDKYLVNTQNLFLNIKDVKEIEGFYDFLSEDQIAVIKRFWSSFNPDYPNKHEKQFIKIWEVLFQIYLELKQNLRKEFLAYEGMLLRDVVENFDNYASKFSNKTYVFIGFNALNVCEEKLFDFLKKRNQALFYWDFENYYVNDTVNESGYFIRKYIDSFPNAISYNVESRLKKKILVYEASGSIDQAKFVSTHLKEILDSFKIKDTVLVLGDENLLLPVVYSLPERVDKVNVSMGYPLKNSSVFSLIDLCLEVFCEERLRYSDLYAFVSNKFIKNVFKKDCIDVLSFLAFNKTVYVYTRSLLDSELKKLIYASNYSHNVLIDKIMRVVKLIGADVNSDLNAIEKELLVKVYTILLNLSRIIINHSELFSKKKILSSVIRKYISGASVSFTGEPLEGLQILGMLETRALDFENIIMFSLNEGSFPKGKSAPSFIPYSLRTGFGLPTLKHQDSIFSYYFHRLLNRSKNITIFYFNEGGGNGSGEMSRFISQLMVNDQYVIEKKLIGYSVLPTQKLCVSVKKTPDLLSEIVSQYKKRPLSPSALFKFIECSLKFYLHQVVKVKEPETLVEIPGENDFGIMFHEILKRVYVSYVDRIVGSEELLSVINNKQALLQCIYDVMSDHLHVKVSADKMSGYDVVLFDMLFKNVMNFLNFELQNQPFSIVGLEHEIYIEKIINNDFFILVGGQVDRIDIKDEVYRLIDYKTGKTNFNVSSIEDLFSSSLKKRNSAVFQILLYSFVLSKLKTNEIHVEPVIYNLRDIAKNEYSSVMINNSVIKNYYEISNDFEKLLQEKIDELFSLDGVFKQTEDSDTCSFCAYKIICGR